MIKLILEERGELQTLELDKDSFTVGRTADNAVRIQDALSSRHHCKLEKTADGWFVEDLKSRNGTTLNGEPLHERKLLAVGDRVAIGQSIIHFGAKLDGKSDKKSAAPPKKSVASAAPKAPAGVSGAKGTTTKKPRYVLKATEGSRSGKAFGVASFPFTIGAKKNVNLALEDEEGVSPEHCMLVEDEGTIHVVDLNSEAGTFVDGKRVKGRERLRAGSTLQLGGTCKLRFKDLAAKEPQSDDDLEALPKSDRVAKQAAPAPVAVEEADLATLGDEPSDEARTPAKAQGRPEKGDKAEKTEKPEKLKTGRRQNPAAAAAATDASALLAEEAGIAAGAELSTQALEQGSEGGSLGALAVVGMAFILLLAAVPIGRAALTKEDPDPEPTGNLVANWSFEADPALKGWTIANGKLVTEGALYGKRAVRLEAAKERGELRAAEPRRLEPGKDVVLHGAIRTKDSAAAVLAIEWTADGRPSWKEVSVAAFLEGRPEWTDVGGSLAPPEGATHARVVAMAVPLGNGEGAVWFDRISVEDQDARPLAGPVKGPGFSVQAGSRGVLAITRTSGAAPVVLARAHLALSAADGARGDALSDQAAWDVTTAASDPGDGGLFADGTILDVASGQRAAAAVAVKAVGETLRASWEVAKKDLPKARTVRVVLDVPRAQDVSPIELAFQSGATRTLEDVFKQAKESYVRLEGVVEMAFGTGAEQASLRPSLPVALEAQKDGDTLRLELVAVPVIKGEQAVLGFDLARASSLARERVRLLFDQAETARRDGRLEEARQVYARIAREFAHEPAVAARAKKEAQVLGDQAERLLEAVVGSAEDAEQLGLPELARSAKYWLVALEKAFPGASQLARAKQAADRAEHETRTATVRSRGTRSRELVSRALKHREANRLRLARTLYRYVVDTFPADDPAAKEAKERLAAMPPEEN